MQLAVPLLPAMQGVTAYTKGSAPGQPFSPPVVDEVTRRDPIFTPTKEEKAVLGTLESYTLKTVLFKADPLPTPGPIYPGEVRIMMHAHYSFVETLSQRLTPLKNLVQVLKSRCYISVLEYSISAFTFF